MCLCLYAGEVQKDDDNQDDEDDGCDGHAASPIIFARSSFTRPSTGRPWAD